MDLTRRLRAWAYARPRVLIVDAADAEHTRWSVEAELDGRGWPVALSPAEADLLLVLGRPGVALAAAIDLFWSQMPEPRYRLHLEAGDSLGTVLDRAAEALGRPAGGGPSGKPSRPDPGELLGDERGTGGGMDHGGTDDASTDDASTDDASMDHGSMDHGSMGDAPTDDGSLDHGGMDHGGMDHGGMDHSGHMGMDVAGLPMAQTAPDRDGLQLDELKVTLGPVLPGWPTGLVLGGRLQGDVLTGVELSWLDPPAGHPDTDAVVDERRAALDRLARFLDVVGWPRAARDARRARDGLASAGSDGAAAHRRAVRLARRVGRSRTLAWSVRGMGSPRLPPLSGQDEGGDVLSRVRQWCATAAGEHDPAGRTFRPDIETVAGMLEGAEVGAARLIVASLPLSRRVARPSMEMSDA